MKKYLLLLLFVSRSLITCGQTDSASQKLSGYFDLSLEELLNIPTEDKSLIIYGYLNANLEKNIHVPSITPAGSTRYKNMAGQWDAPKYVHLYISRKLNDRFEVFLNIAKTPENTVEIRNGYGNIKLSELFQLRIGKMYRKLGLYNEKLDQVPTFIGIEPPEIFDADHLFVPRTTNVMLHGRKQSYMGEFSYGLSTENGEDGNIGRNIPLGWDVRIKKKSMILGTSGFTSSILSSRTPPSVQLGKGLPFGGVLPWMTADKYTLFGGFIECESKNILIQAGYWSSHHKALRDPSKVLQLIKNADLNQNQRNRFLGRNNSKADATLTENDIRIKSNYSVQTAFVRLGYTINSHYGLFIPYMLWDWMSDPEVISNKLYGGDEEAGFSDNGIFYKPTLGLLYRPVENVAVKLDASSHMQKFNGKLENYFDLRLDISFAFSSSFKK